jgi:hypothetical protein
MKPTSLRLDYQVIKARRIPRSVWALVVAFSLCGLLFAVIRLNHWRKGGTTFSPLIRHFSMPPGLNRAKGILVGGGGTSSCNSGSGLARSDFEFCFTPVQPPPLDPSGIALSWVKWAQANVPSSAVQDVSTPQRARFSVTYTLPRAGRIPATSGIVLIEAVQADDGVGVQVTVSIDERRQ